MIPCPSCHALLPSTDLVDGVAQCASCEHIFAVADAPARSTASDAPLERQPRAPVELPGAPSGVVVIHHDQHMEIRLPWRHDQGALALIVLVLLCVGTMVAGYLDPNPYEAWSFLLIALLTAASMVYSLTNATTVVVAPQGVDVSHGPLPTRFPSVTLGRGNLSVLSLEKDVPSWLSSRPVTYDLREEVSGTLILAGWRSHAHVAFVRDSIRAWYAQPR